MSAAQRAADFERETYTIDEVAQKLGISRSAAYSGARAEDFPVRRVRRRWLVPREEFDAWLGSKNCDPWTIVTAPRTDAPAAFADASDNEPAVASHPRTAASAPDDEDRCEGCGRAHESDNSCPWRQKEIFVWPTPCANRATSPPVGNRDMSPLDILKQIAGQSGDSMTEGYVVVQFPGRLGYQIFADGRVMRFTADTEAELSAREILNLSRAIAANPDWRRIEDAYFAAEPSTPEIHDA